MVKIINILLVLQGVFLYVQSEDRLIAVNLLYRHGDRTPLKFYPNDIYQDPSYWPTGLGDLTNIGKEQHYELGKWFRERYNDSLSPVYDQDEIYIRSSNNDRCLMSAESNLAGLYPPVGKDVWLDNMPWQPIPVHTVPEEYDDIAEAQISCAIYDTLKDQAEELPYFKNLKLKYQYVYDILTENTGMEVSKIVQVGDIYDTFLIEKIYNFTIPQWAIDIFGELKVLRDNGSKLLSFTSLLGQIFIGRYFDNVKDHFTNIDKKFKIFSAHDDQVYSIMNVLKVPNLESPPYRAVVIFELKETDSNQISGPEKYVQVYYKTPDNLTTLKICDGNEKCPLEKFMEIIEPLRITKENFKEYCTS